MIDHNAYTQAAFAGQLNLMKIRSIRFDSATGDLLLLRGGYAGFRLYTSTIDQVSSVKIQLENEGIMVNTEEERIAEVRRLDNYLGLVFWLIASVGVVGGISSLSASLYAAVERKKKDLNVLRLLGLLKSELVRFPVYQGLIISGGALILAGTLFLLVSIVINNLFSEHLRANESLCTFTFSHFFILSIGLSLLSIFSAAFASIRATRMDPAEALRDE